jgi:FlaA1/EpsC-like NDP-sugar epimerase
MTPSAPLPDLTPGPCLAPGAVILVTGATGGIGFEIASQAAAGSRR